MRLHKRKIGFLFLLALAGSAAGLTLGGRFTPPAIGLVADTLTVFEAGKVAKASEVNDNFQKLRASTEKINGVQTYLSGLVGELETEFELQDEVIAEQAEQIATLRSAGLRRPSFRWVNADSIVIDGAASRPMPVALGAEIRLLSTTLDVHTTIVGPGGLDGGVAVPNRLYYLYIVPVPAGEIAGIASLNPPTTAGPFGHATWTYLGSFVTGNSAEVLRFVFAEGEYKGWSGATGAEVVTTSDLLTAGTLLIPAHAAAVFGRISIGSAIAGDSLSGGPTETGTLTILRAEEDAVTPVAFLELPVLEPSTIYLAITAGATGVFRPLGWTEDPLRFP